MKKFFLITVFFIISTILFSEKFTFKYEVNRKQKIIATIKGKQYQNNVFLLNYNQYYKTIRIIEEIKNNSALIKDINEYYNENTFYNNQVLQINNIVSVTYLKDGLGKIKVYDNSYFPTLRDIPVFPDKDINPGDTWEAPGYEIQNLFNDNVLTVFPINVKYTFLGYDQVNKKKAAKFLYEYSLDISDSVDPRIRTVGKSSTIMYFDNQTGSRISEEYKRDYSFLLKNDSGKFVATFVDDGRRVWEPIIPIEKDKIIDDLNKDLKDNKIDDTDVKKDERGVKLSLNNLHFYPDSTKLLPEEEERLEKISEILKKYKNNKIMILGHTAEVGTEEKQLKLSIDRAKTILDYLINKNAVIPDKSVFGGKGSKEPVGDNSTEEGRKKNRRVEIYILEE